jgi:hypothetical protein
VRLVGFIDKDDSGMRGRRRKLVGYDSKCLKKLILK